MNCITSILIIRKFMRIIIVCPYKLHDSKMRFLRFGDRLAHGQAGSEQYRAVGDTGHRSVILRTRGTALVQCNSRGQRKPAQVRVAPLNFAHTLNSQITYEQSKYTSYVPVAVCNVKHLHCYHSYTLIPSLNVNEYDRKKNWY